MTLFFCTIMGKRGVLVYVYIRGFMMGHARPMCMMLCFITGNKYEEMEMMNAYAYTIIAESYDLSPNADFF
jgi:hypothetical protein